MSLYTQPAHDATVLAVPIPALTAPPVADTTDASGHPASSVFQDLPLELLHTLCEQLGQGELANFSRVCSVMQAPAEVALWKSLNITPSSSNWGIDGTRSPCSGMPNQRGWKKVITQLYLRPDFAVQHLTIGSAVNNSNLVPKLLNKIAHTLRSLRMVPSPSLSNETWMISLTEVLRNTSPMPRVHHLDLVLDNDWYETLKLAISVCSNIRELRLLPQQAWSSGWADSPTVYEDAPDDAHFPSAPSLRLLTVENMSASLEGAVMSLVGSSEYPVKLILSDPVCDPARIWTPSREFVAFVQRVGGGLILEMGLPDEDEKESRFFAWGAELDSA